MLYVTFQKLKEIVKIFLLTLIILILEELLPF